VSRIIVFPVERTTTSAAADTASQKRGVFKARTLLGGRPWIYLVSQAGEKVLECQLPPHVEEWALIEQLEALLDVLDPVTVQRAAPRRPRGTPRATRSSGFRPPVRGSVGQSCDPSHPAVAGARE